jgi:hypothetical protein
VRLLPIAIFAITAWAQPAHQFSPLEKRQNQRIVDLENQLLTQRKWRREAEEKLKSTPVVNVNKVVALQKDAMAAHVADVKDAKTATEATKATADKILVSTQATEASSRATEAKAEHIEKVVEDYSLQKTLAVNFPAIITLLLAAVAAIATVSNNRQGKRTEARVVQIAISTEAVKQASNGRLTALMTAHAAALRDKATALRATVQALRTAPQPDSALIKTTWTAAADAERIADAAEEALRVHIESTAGCGAPECTRNLPTAKGDTP